MFEGQPKWVPPLVIAGLIVAALLILSPSIVDSVVDQKTDRVQENLLKMKDQLMNGGVKGPAGQIDGPGAEILPRLKGKWYYTVVLPDNWQQDEASRAVIGNMGRDPFIRKFWNHPNVEKVTYGERDADSTLR